jgi:hypothetical protein
MAPLTSGPWARTLQPISWSGRLEGPETLALRRWAGGGLLESTQTDDSRAWRFRQHQNAGASSFASLIIRSSSSTAREGQ